MVSMPHLDATAAHLVLLALAYLLVKHAFADFFLQTDYQRLNKGIYGHAGGLVHCAWHIALTAPVFLILPPPSALYGAAILAAEAIAHYHIDWTKERVVKANGWGLSSRYFWRAIGLDQLMHGLTYVAIVWALAG